MKSTSRKKIIVVLLALAISVISLLLFYRAAREIELKQYTEKRSVMTEGFGTLRSVDYNGQTYVEKQNISVVLMIGVDEWVGETENSYRSGGHADFLLLLIIDHQSDRVYTLQIDRAAMTRVATLGIFGDFSGHRTMQISLAHGFGETEDRRCANTVEAVKTLLPGINSMEYVVLNPEIIKIFTDLLGGVPVDLTDDFSEYEPSMRTGETVLLNGDMAEVFVRARMGVGDGTNESRMRRQRAYLEAAIPAFHAKMNDKTTSFDELLSILEPYYETSMSHSYGLKLLLQMFNYEIQPITVLQGEYVIGDDGYVEYWVDSDAALSWVIERCYEENW